MSVLLSSLALRLYRPPAAARKAAKAKAKAKAKANANANAIATAGWQQTADVGGRFDVDSAEVKRGCHRKENNTLFNFRSPAPLMALGPRGRDSVDCPCLWKKQAMGSNFLNAALFRLPESSLEIDRLVCAAVGWGQPQDLYARRVYATGYHIIPEIARFFLQHSQKSRTHFRRHLLTSTSKRQRKTGHKKAPATPLNSAPPPFSRNRTTCLFPAGGDNGVDGTARVHLLLLPHRRHGRAEGNRRRRRGSPPSQRGEPLLFSIVLLSLMMMQRRC